MHARIVDRRSSIVSLGQLRHFLGWLLPTALSIGALLLELPPGSPTYQQVLAADSQRRMVQL
ncbi:MAG: hypothetical protein ACJ8CR_16905 [Roseiflexaceae bacterium]